jgi:hypothetical protein
MPIIPKPNFQVVPTEAPVSPAMAGAPAGAAAQTWSDIAGEANKASRYISYVQEAAAKVKAAELGQAIDDDFKDATASYKMRTDFENFQTDAEKQTNALWEKYQKAGADDPRLAQVIQATFQNKARDFSRTIGVKYAEQVANRGRGILDQNMTTALDSYSNELDPNQRKLIADRFIAEAHQMAESGIIPFKEAVDLSKNFTDSAESVRVEKAIQADPLKAIADLRGGEYQLNPTIKQQKIEKAQTKIDQDERQAKIEEDRLDRQMEKVRKTVIDKNDLDMEQAYYNGTLKVKDLDALASNQMISLGTYNRIKEKLNKGEPDQNDRFVVGEIASMIEMHDIEGARKALETAANKGQIKTETYVSMRKELASKAFGDATRYVNKYTEPSPLETNMDMMFRRAQINADAIDELTLRAGKGEDPGVVKYEIIKRIKGTQEKVISQMRDPKFLTGDKVDRKALAEAKQKTLDAFRNGTISGPDYNDELQLISNIEGSLKYLDLLKGSDADMSSEMKSMKVGK